MYQIYIKQGNPPPDYGNEWRYVSVKSGPNAAPIFSCWIYAEDAAAAEQFLMLAADAQRQLDAAKIRNEIKLAKAG